MKIRCLACFHPAATMAFCCLSSVRGPRLCQFGHIGQFLTFHVQITFGSVFLCFCIFGYSNMKCVTSQFYVGAWRFKIGNVWLNQKVFASVVPFMSTKLLFLFVSSVLFPPQSDTVHNIWELSWHGRAFLDEPKVLHLVPSTLFKMPFYNVHVALVSMGLIKLHTRKWPTQLSFQPSMRLLAYHRNFIVLSNQYFTRF